MSKSSKPASCDYDSNWTLLLAEQKMVLMCKLCKLNLGIVIIVNQDVKVLPKGKYLVYSENAKITM